MPKKCRVAVSASGETLDSDIGPISRSPYFVIFEGSPDNHRAMKNRASGMGDEAGPQAADALVKNDITIVITSTVGAKTFQALRKADIVVHAGCSGKVSEAIQKCLHGELPECRGATYAGRVNL